MVLRCLFASVMVGGVCTGCGPAVPSVPKRLPAHEIEIQRCLQQEKYGPAPGCWVLWLEQHRRTAPEASVKRVANRLREFDEPHRSIPRRENPSQPHGDSPPPLAVLVEPAGDENFPPQTADYRACYRGFRVSGHSQRDVTELGNLCGTPCGMLPFTGLLSGEQRAQDELTPYRLSLRADRCYRFFAVGDDKIQDLDAALLDSRGHPVLRDVFNDAAPILGMDGPYCPNEPGQYTLLVSVSSGEGQFHFQVWHGPRR